MKIDAVKTIEKIKNILHNSGDLKSRVVQFFDTKVSICYFAEITDNMLLNDSLIDPILEYDGEFNDTLKHFKN